MPLYVDGTEITPAQEDLLRGLLNGLGLTATTLAGAAKELVEQIALTAQSGVVIVATRAAMLTFYATDENQSKLVYVNQDPIPENNGVFEWVDGAPRVAEYYYQHLTLMFEELLAQVVSEVSEISSIVSLTGPEIGSPLRQTLGSAPNMRVLWEYISSSKALRYYTGLYLPPDKTFFTGMGSLPIRNLMANVVADEVSRGIQFTIGNRLYADIEPGSGLYVRKGVLAADRVFLDDDLETPIVDRLGGGGGGSGSESGPDIVVVGDSLSATYPATPTYPQVLATLTGRTVRNYGVGGETSITIAGRFSRGFAYDVTIPDGAIPASGPVTVTLLGPDGQTVAPLVQDSTGVRGINPCRIAGVSGTLTLSSGVYTFTRAAAGSVVQVPFPVQFITESMDSRQNDILIYETGQNGGYGGVLTTLFAQDEAVFRELTRPGKRWLRLGFSTGTQSSRAATDAAMLERYGRRFVNHRKYLASTAALQRQGITPTSDDLTSIAAGSVPPSFLADPIHINTAGAAAKAYYVDQRLREFGWVV